MSAWSGSPRAVACPDSLKGVLAARDAAGALAAGLRRAGVEAEERPLADGGEGTADVLVEALGGEWRVADVSDPLGRRVPARYGIVRIAGEPAAVVESAEAIGLSRLARGELDPVRASSRGLGELILAAVGSGAERVIVTLGGSATVDGGAGMREVLDDLPVPVEVACDVRNPLLGERGAARVFAPQKGATPAQVEELERRLASMHELRAVADLAGAGAAGGLGAALAALGAELVPGIELVLELIDFERSLRRADLAVTGEGAVDGSSGEGKTATGVAAACARAAVPCVVFGGRVEPGAAAALYALGATSVFRLSGDPRQAASDLAELGEALGRLARALPPGA
ncbi:MAG: glycerate kinase [Actinomycetota bacterium]|nr:glycerate kinase [Actinomycetota bacterium]